MTNVLQVIVDGARRVVGAELGGLGLSGGPEVQLR